MVTISNKIVDIFVYLILYWSICLITITLWCYLPINSLLFHIYPFTTVTMRSLRLNLFEKLLDIQHIQLKSYYRLCYELLSTMLFHTCLLFQLYLKEALMLIIAISVLFSDSSGLFSRNHYYLNEINHDDDHNMNNQDMYESKLSDYNNSYRFPASLISKLSNYVNGVYNYLSFYVPPLKYFLPYYSRATNNFLKSILTSNSSYNDEDIYEEMPALESNVQTMPTNNYCRFIMNTHRNSEGICIHTYEFIKPVIIPCQYCNTKSGNCNISYDKSFTPSSSSLRSNRINNLHNCVVGNDSNQYNDIINNNHNQVKNHQSDILSQPISETDRPDKRDRNNNNTAYIYDPVYGVIPWEVWKLWQQNDLEKLQQLSSKSEYIIQSDMSTVINLNHTSEKKIRNRSSNSVSDNTFQSCS